MSSFFNNNFHWTLIPGGNNNSTYKFIIFVIIKGGLAAEGWGEVGGPDKLPSP